MKITFWLVVNRNRSIRTVKGKPQLKWDEIAIYCTLDIPVELFNRPTLSAEIAIPSDKIPESHIEAETIQGLEEVLKQEGFNVKLSIKSEEVEEP